MGVKFFIWILYKAFRISCLAINFFISGKLYKSSAREAANWSLGLLDDFYNNWMFVEFLSSKVSSIFVFNYLVFCPSAFCRIRSLFLQKLDDPVESCWFSSASVHFLLPSFSSFSDELQPLVEWFEDVLLWKLTLLLLFWKLTLLYVSTQTSLYI